MESFDVFLKIVDICHWYSNKTHFIVIFISKKTLQLEWFIKPRKCQTLIAHQQKLNFKQSKIQHHPEISYRHQFPFSCYHLQFYQKENSHKNGRSSFVVDYFSFFSNTIKFFVIPLVLKTTMTMMITVLRRITQERQSNWSKLNFNLIKERKSKSFEEEMFSLQKNQWNKAQ